MKLELELELEAKGQVEVVLHLCWKMSKGLDFFIYACKHTDSRKGKMYSRID